jgi:hypothetical protein
MFTPTKYVATCCNSIIFSEYSGQFKSCQCGKSFVDQTEYYVRIGGTVEDCRNVSKILEDAEELSKLSEDELFKLLGKLVTEGTNEKS